MKFPQPCEALSAIRPVQIVGGEQTLFAVTAEGKVCFFVCLLCFLVAWLSFRRYCSNSLCFKRSENYIYVERQRCELLHT